MKLSIMKEKTTVAEIALATGLNTDKVKEMIVNRTSNIINIGFVEGILVEDTKPKSVKQKKYIYTKKYDNKYYKDIPYYLDSAIKQNKEDDRLKRNSIEFRGKKWGAVALAKKLGITYAQLAKCCRTYKEMVFNGETIKIKRVPMLLKTFKYTKDGVNVNKDLTARELDDVLKCAKSKMYRSIKDHGYYIQMDTLYFAGDIKNIIPCLPYIGIDQNRMYFGFLNNIRIAMGINCPQVTLQNHISHQTEYNFMDQRIIKGENFSEEDIKHLYK